MAGAEILQTTSTSALTAPLATPGKIARSTLMTAPAKAVQTMEDALIASTATRARAMLATRAPTARLAASRVAKVHVSTKPRTAARLVQVANTRTCSLTKTLLANGKHADASKASLTT